MRAILAILCGFIMCNAALGQVVIDMPAPKRPPAVVQPAPAAASNATQPAPIPADVGALALQRYALARTATYDTYGATGPLLAARHYFYDYPGFWGYPFFGCGRSVFLGPVCQPFPCSGGCESDH